MRIQSVIKNILIWSSLFLLCFLTGCVATHPLHISDQDWQYMSSSDQFKAYEKQADIDRSRSVLRAEEKRVEAALLLKRQEQLMILKKNARYGDLVECILEPLEVRYSRKWKESRPVAFSLVRGEVKSLDFNDQKGRYRTTAWVKFHDEGQTISICQRQSQTSGLSGCVDLLGTTKEYHRGISRKIQLDKFLRAGLRCDLQPINRAWRH